MNCTTALGVILGIVRWQYMASVGEGRILSEREVLDALGGVVRPRPPLDAMAIPVNVSGTPPEPELDRERVEHILQKLGGNKSAAARELGVSRRALYRRLESFGLR